MSEKRILCTEVEQNCQYLVDINLSADAFECQQGFYCSKSTTCKPITKDTCKICKEGRYQGLTREQTIYKIAKALCRTDGEDCETCSFNGNEKGCKKYLETGNYITQAEVALEDILDGYDD